MAFNYSFQKILEWKEQERDHLHAQYNKSVEQFETVAYQLYDLLKKKEQLEQEQEVQMKKGIPISQLQQQQVLFMRIHKQILAQQHRTDKARMHMHKKQEELTNKSIELKQFERLKQSQKKEHEAFIKREEEKALDEMATLKYSTR